MPIVNDATGVQYFGKSNEEGVYVVRNLPPGPYRLQVGKTGFKTIIKPDVVLNVEDALAINFTLPIGAASEIVTVEGGTPMINTTNTNASAPRRGHSGRPPAGSGRGSTLGRVIRTSNHASPPASSAASALSTSRPSSTDPLVVGPT